MPLHVTLPVLRRKMGPGAAIACPPCRWDRLMATATGRLEGAEIGCVPQKLTTGNTLSPLRLCCPLHHPDAHSALSWSMAGSGQPGKPGPICSVQPWSRGARVVSAQSRSLLAGCRVCGGGCACFLPLCQCFKTRGWGGDSMVAASGHQERKGAKRGGQCCALKSPWIKSRRLAAHT